MFATNAYQFTRNSLPAHLVRRSLRSGMAAAWLLLKRTLTFALKWRNLNDSYAPKAGQPGVEVSSCILSVTHGSELTAQVSHLPSLPLGLNEIPPLRTPQTVHDSIPGHPSGAEVFSCPLSVTHGSKLTAHHSQNDARAGSAGADSPSVVFSSQLTAQVSHLPSLPLGLNEIPPLRTPETVHDSTGQPVPPELLDEYGRLKRPKRKRPPKRPPGVPPRGSGGGWNKGMKQPRRINTLCLIYPEMITRTGHGYRSAHAGTVRYDHGKRGLTAVSSVLAKPLSVPAFHSPQPAVRRPHLSFPIFSYSLWPIVYSLPFQHRHHLDVRRLREHVVGFGFHQFIPLELFQVSDEGLRIAGDVDNAFRAETVQLTYQLRGKAGTWWVDDDRVWRRAFVEGEEVVGVVEDELDVVNVIALHIPMRQLDILLHHLNPNHLAGLFRGVDADGAGAAEQVEGQAVDVRRRPLIHLVHQQQVVLEEAAGADLEGKIADGLFEDVPSPDLLDFAVGIIADPILHRPDHHLAMFLQPFREGQDGGFHVEGDQDDHQLVGRKCVPEGDVTQVATFGDQVPATDVEFVQPVVHDGQEFADSFRDDVAFVEVDDGLAVPTFTQADLPKGADIVHPVTVIVRFRAGYDLHRPFEMLLDYCTFRGELGFIWYILK